ncbi:MAG TPA: 2-keto-4-pentenoate hydratase [Feifaniaceae bacterium]|nr:2-keto-4-pentenoate hydratase [Feifaniaceae bacterium]
MMSSDISADDRSALRNGKYTKEILARCADRLEQAERTRIAIAPLTLDYPDLTPDDAYAIQLLRVEKLVAGGAVVSGKKIGLTSPGMQKLLGVGEPDYGHLFTSMDRSGDVEADQLMQPKIEAEIAFLLGADLPDRDVSAADVLQATESVAAAFEIVDSRIADWKIKLADTIADNASSGRYVLGKRRVSPEGLDLRSVTMKVERTGAGVVSEGVGSAVMGDPAVSVAWLANCLRRYGVLLKRGEIILSGAFSAALPAHKGDEFIAAFSSLGSVSARFI